MSGARWSRGGPPPVASVAIGKILCRSHLPNGRFKVNSNTSVPIIARKPASRRRLEPPEHPYNRCMRTLKYGTAWALAIVTMPAVQLAVAQSPEERTRQALEMVLAGN